MCLFFKEQAKTAEQLIDGKYKLSVNVLSYIVTTLKVRKTQKQTVIYFLFNHLWSIQM